MVNSLLIPWYQCFITHVEAVQDLVSKFLLCWMMICLGPVVEIAHLNGELNDAQSGNDDR